MARRNRRRAGHHNHHHGHHHHHGRSHIGPRVRYGHRSYGGYKVRGAAMPCGCGVALLFIGIFLIVPGISLTAMGTSFDFGPGPAFRIIGPIILGAALICIITGIIMCIIVKKKMSQASQENPGTVMTVVGPDGQPVPQNGQDTTVVMAGAQPGGASGLGVPQPAPYGVQPSPYGGQPAPYGVQPAYGTQPAYGPQAAVYGPSGGIATVPYPQTSPYGAPGGPAYGANFNTEYSQPGINPSDGAPPAFAPDSGNQGTAPPPPSYEDAVEKMS